MTLSATQRRTILVEVRKNPQSAAILERMAETCRAMGHHVVRWRGPLSGRMPYGRWLPVCDLAILFNGAHRSYRPALARLRAWGAATLLVELGWHPQAERFQVDPLGVNAAASWARDCVEVEGNTPLEVRREGDLLVLLQLDDDTQITERSAWFPNMERFVRFVCRESRLAVRVRPHPKATNNAQMRRLVEACRGTWDESPSLAGSLACCRAVACINSSAAVEAMDQGLPVLCYGDAVYRHGGAAYCLNDDPTSTHDATAELAQGGCTLTREKVAAVVQRIVDKQWTIDDVSLRLPPLMTQLLSNTPSISPRLTSSDRVEQTIYWLADLPAKVLYRRRLKPKAVET